MHPSKLGTILAAGAVALVAGAATAEVGNQTSSPAFAQTPQGLLVQLNTGANLEGTWKRLFLAKEPVEPERVTGPRYLSFEPPASQDVVNTRLSSALSQNQLFLVLATSGQNADRLWKPLIGNFGIGGFEFDLRILEKSQTVLVFKFNDSISLVDLVKRPSLWSGKADFVGDSDRVTTVQHLLKKSLETGGAVASTNSREKNDRTPFGQEGDASTPDPFAHFKNIAWDPNWTGILMFNNPIVGGSMHVQMLLGGVKGTLRSHHLGIQVNHLGEDRSQGRPPWPLCYFPIGRGCNPLRTAKPLSINSLNSSSMFGAIHYQSSPDTATRSTVAPKQAPKQDFEYSLEYLAVAFNNSLVTQFRAEVGLTINKLFGRSVALKHAPDHPAKKSVGAITLAIEGLYERHGKIDTVRFATKKAFEYELVKPPNSSRILDRVIIARATLAPVKSTVKPKVEGKAKKTARGGAHTSPLKSGSISDTFECSAFMSIMDELARREQLSCEHIFETSRDKAANALGFAATVAKGVFVKVGLHLTAP